MESYDNSLCHNSSGQNIRSQEHSSSDVSHAKLSTGLSSIHDNSAVSGDSKKKRGKKGLTDQEYFKVNNDKIDQWEQMLKDGKGKLSQKEIKAIQNKISA